MVPNNYISLDEMVQKNGINIRKLDELDDVIDIYHNWEE